jgi:hypothetical protein
VILSDSYIRGADGQHESQLWEAISTTKGPLRLS